jgi:hypothetical protein
VGLATTFLLRYMRRYGRRWVNIGIRVALFIFVLLLLIVQMLQGGGFFTVIGARTVAGLSHCRADGSRISLLMLLRLLLLLLLIDILLVLLLWLLLLLLLLVLLTLRILAGSIQERYLGFRGSGVVPVVGKTRHRRRGWTGRHRCGWLHQIAGFLFRRCRLGVL